MSLSKLELTTKSAENTGIEEEMKEPMITSEPVKTGTKPKYYLPYWERNLKSVSSFAPLTNREHKPALMKTKICDHWRRSGTCSYGDSCWYAHGEDDLRKSNLPRKGKDTSSCSSEDVVVAKIAEDTKPMKRSSTNVKGLTVTIPQSIGSKEQVSADSMPLSPAQERWISMSVGQNAAEKTGETLAKVETEPTATKLEKTIGFLRDEDVRREAATYGLSYLVNPTQLTSGSSMINNAHVNRGGRTYSGFGGGMPSSRSSRLTTPGTAPFSHLSSSHNPRSTTTRNSDNPPPIQQAIWNVAGEIYQRQKDIETRGGGVGPIDYQETVEMSRMMSKLTKAKDLAMIRYMLENGMLNERQIAREAWNELHGSGYNLQPPSHSQHAHHHGHSAYNAPSNYSNNYCPCDHSHHQHHQSQQQQHLHQHLNRQPHHHQHALNFHLPPQYRRPAAPELSAPPKMFENLLPPDETFSIWLDQKPRKNSNLHGNLSNLQQSDSGVSLLTKMDALRSKDFPLVEEEIRAAAGSVGTDEKSSESSSPPVLSLMELLSSENLLDEQQPTIQKTMFDFDSLKVAETMKTSTMITPKTAGKESPTFYVMDEKTPGIYEPSSAHSSGLFTPLPTPSYSEPCDFFAAGGSCPFGDNCHQSHSITG